MRPNLIAVLLAFAPTSVVAQHEPHGGHGGQTRLGVVDPPSSGAARARPAFHRGIALLHSFEYVDAAEAFREAQRLDSTFAIAYWGEALTYRHLLWGQEDLGAARAVLARFGPSAEARLARRMTPWERAYGAAVEALFADTSEPVRARAFADSMRVLVRARPDDLEAQAFAALAILGAAHFARGDEHARLYAEAGALAERVFRARPRHPGAAHYVIHAYDDPTLARRGLAAARAFARIAPDAQHALHMPSHIFVQLGLWNEVAASNEESWAASRAWVARRGMAPTALDFHSLQWLQYAYIQQGRWALARSLIDTARSVLLGATYGPSVDARHAVGRMAFQWMSETGTWDSALAALVRVEGTDTASARGRAFVALSEYQEALVAAVVRGDTMPAATLAARQLARAELPPGARLRAELLRAAVARLRGDTAADLEALEHAAAAEAEIPAVGPPGQRPAIEQLAWRLHEAGRAPDAVRRYQEALRRFPNRSTAHAGLVATADAPVGARARASLRANYRRADRGVLAGMER